MQLVYLLVVGIALYIFSDWLLRRIEQIESDLERHGVTLKVFCTTGGDLGSLIPPLVDAGINVLWVSNIMSSSMEYARLRRELGPDLGLIGGIDASALTESDDAVRREVGETAPPLLAGGRYIPCLNDRPRENVPFARYALFRELLSELAE